MKKVLLFCIIAIASITICLSGCISNDKVENKVFDIDGLSITLTSDFKEQPEDGYTILYTKDIKLTVQTVPTSSLNGLTQNDYLAQICEGLDGAVFLTDKEAENLPAIEYSLSGDSTFADSSCILAVYSSDDVCWNITFSCSSDYYSVYRSQFIAWLQTITIP